MEKILFLAHTEADGGLAKVALEALGAAKGLVEALPGSALCVGLVGEDVKGAADQIASCGAEKFLAAQGAEFAQPRYASDAAACEALCKACGATVVVAAATSRFSRVLSGVAFRTGGRADTHVTAIGAAGGTIQVTRWYYRQRMMGVVERTHRPWILSVDQGSFPAWQGAAGAASVEAVAAELPEAARRTKVEGIQAPPASQQTIRPDSSLLFVAGAGWTKKQRDGQPHTDQAEQLILGFLNKAQASLGSSKSLVDQSGEGQAVLTFMTHLNQVGQTGSTPRHPKGLSTCCHGEEPHVVGWRFITERRAVNLDPNCGWAHGKADVLYVADAFEVMKKVNELLS